MKIKLLANLRIAGKHAATGSIVTVADQLARELIARGVAINVFFEEKKSEDKNPDEEADASEEPAPKVSASVPAKK